MRPSAALLFSHRFTGLNTRQAVMSTVAVS